MRGCRLSQRKITCLAQKFCLFIILTSSRAEAASRHELRFAIFLCLPPPLLTPCKVWNEAGKKLLGSHMLPVAVCQGVPKNYTLHFNHNSNQRNHRHYSHSRSRRSSRQHFSACAKWKNATWAKLLPRNRSTWSQCCCCSSLTCQAAVGDNANVMGNKVPRVFEFSQYFIAPLERVLNIGSYCSFSGRIWYKNRGRKVLKILYPWRLLPPLIVSVLVINNGPKLNGIEYIKYYVSL